MKYIEHIKNVCTKLFSSMAAIQIHLRSFLPIETKKEPNQY